MQIWRSPLSLSFMPIEANFPCCRLVDMGKKKREEQRITICMGKCFLSFLHDLSVPTACFVCRVQFSHGSYPVGNAVHLDITLPFSPEKIQSSFQA